MVFKTQQSKAVAGQEARVAALELQGRDATLARQLLETFRGGSSIFSPA